MTAPGPPPRSNHPSTHRPWCECCLRHGFRSTHVHTHLVVPPVHANVLQCDVDVPPLSKGKGGCDGYEWPVIPAASSPLQCSDTGCCRGQWTTKRTQQRQGNCWVTWPQQHPCEPRSHVHDLTFTGMMCLLRRCVMTATEHPAAHAAVAAVASPCGLTTLLTQSAVAQGPVC